MFKFTPIKTKQQKDQELEKTIQQPEKVVEKTSRMFDFTPIEVKKEEIVEQPKIKPVIPSLIPEKQPEFGELLFKKIETPEKSITETTKEAVPETKEVIVPEKTHPIYSFFDKMLEATTEGLNKSLERLSNITAPVNEKFEWLVKPIEKITTEAFGKAATSIPETLLDTTKRLKAFEEIQKTGVTTDEETGEQKYATTADKIGKGIEVGVGAANTAFIPITSIFSAAKEVPGLNIPVEAIEWVFGKAGEIGTLGGDKLLNALPISDEDKQSLALPVAELTGLVGMIVLGGSLFKGVSKGVEVAKNKITESKPGTPEYNDAVKEILDTENTDALMDKTIDKLETEIKAVKEKGEDITPEKAQEIVNKVNEEVLLKPEVKEEIKVEEKVEEKPKEETIEVFRGETPGRVSGDIIKGKAEFGDAPFVSFADNAKLAERFGDKVNTHSLKKSEILDLDLSKDQKALKIVDNEIDLSKEQVKKLNELGYKAISFDNLEPGYKGKEIRYFGDFNIKEHPVIKETKKAQVKPKEIEVKPEKEVVSEKDRIDALIEKEKSLTENMDKYQKEKALKGIGMEYAGYKRAIEGKPTQIEKSKARSYLESNHKGKEVEVAGKQGTLTGKVAFGSHEIQFKDGTKKFVKGENIRSEHITDKMVLDYIKDEALKKIKGKEDLYGIKPEKEVKKPEVKIEEKPEIKKPESKKVIEKPEVKKKKIEEVKKPETKEEKEKKKFQSRVYERMQAEYADILKDDLTYERMNLKKDAEKAVKLIEKDKQEAYEVATGMKEPPEGQTSTAVNIALTEKALAEGNNSLASTLIKNRSLAQTRRGQEIVAEKGSISDNSVSRYVKELINARMETLKTYTFDIKTLKRKTKKQQVIEKIDMETQKAQKKIKNKELDLEEAQKLIDSIICK